MAGCWRGQGGYKEGDPSGPPAGPQETAGLLLQGNYWSLMDGYSASEGASSGSGKTLGDTKG